MRFYTNWQSSSGAAGRAVGETVPGRLSASVPGPMPQCGDARARAPTPAGVPRDAGRRRRRPGLSRSGARRRGGPPSLAPRPAARSLPAVVTAPAVRPAPTLGGGVITAGLAATAGFFLRRRPRAALAAQLLHAGADRRKIIGSAGSSHVSSCNLGEARTRPSGHQTGQAKGAAGTRLRAAPRPASTALQGRRCAGPARRPAAPGWTGRLRRRTSAPAAAGVPARTMVGQAEEIMASPTKLSHIVLQTNRRREMID